VPAMSPAGLATVFLSLIFLISCGGMTNLTPTAASGLPPHSTPSAVGASPVSGHEMQGTIGPFPPGARTCFADLFPCEVFTFSLPHEGPIELAMSWDGNPRALFVQLYWAGRWLAHEDVAPREGPPEISFVRPIMEANSYELRIVSREPQSAIPYRLVIRY
jgi:hypothetical protein